ncbi:type III restriction-modification system endonuclease [Veillonella sp.]|uniref:type III restriction-modification system endonuclease n=1 Tax=Veillonella sp. TaxID=1926307 RepID=UPI0025F6B326|nr:type III restriction-modification system endonuclease [Veillonella sp.]
MGIKLNILPHQTECIRRLADVFDGVEVKNLTDTFANPFFDIYNSRLKDNIANIQSDTVGGKIPFEYRTSIPTEFGIDVRMETGTGKTYCYTRLMYELNKLYGFYKFIILVPTTPIKEGTYSFITSDYAKQHFSDLYPGKKIELSVLNAQKKTKGRKMFPQAVSDFARVSRLEKDKISALLMSSAMLISKATMDNEYDQTLLGNYSNPYDTLRATRPIVIIDEPHKFKRENIAYRRLIERINPLCVIRFGATFPELNNQKKDYNNLVYNLGPCEAFNNNLVKGVATQLIEQETLNETRVKVLDINKSNPKFCTIRNEKTGKTYNLGVNESLSIVSNDFSGVTIQSIGKTDEEIIKTGVTLSNGQILAKGAQVYARIYSKTYQELMLEQAIKNHIKQERENFLRSNKIKTLSLFFIDSIESYRGEDGVGPLRLKFQELLKKYLKEEWEQHKLFSTDIEKEYCSFLGASLDRLDETNGGYFSEDNSTSDAAIQKEVDQILKDKESLLSFKDDNGQWNVRRFIFSKWTLREGWDNPNVFQICKLRSSGSEISKLQEVGRGLRLPVDEFGNRLGQEQFYLTYLCDYSEKDFAKSLIEEINKDNKQQSRFIGDLLDSVASQRNLSAIELMINLLKAGYIDSDKNIIEEKQDEFFAAYPEFNKGLAQNKVINKNKNDKSIVRIREDKFEDLRNLWDKINEKYYLKLDSIPDNDLYKATLEILNKNISGVIYANTVEQKVKFDQNNQAYVQGSIVSQYEMDECIPYGEFLKKIHHNTGLPIAIMHKALCTYNKDKKIDKTFFNQKSLAKFIEFFQVWFENAFLTRFSYKPLGVNKMETALTDINGNVRGSIIQGVIGIIRDDTLVVPDNFLYDQVVFDSPKERENICQSDIDKVVVFGKIPRRSVQVPLYFGGTTSPDFMYVIKREHDYEVNLIVETKDVDKDSTLRGVEKLKIESAKKFFETLKASGVNVVFKPQLKNDDIIPMLEGLEE